MDVDNDSQTKSPDREPENIKGTVPTQTMTVQSKSVSSCLSCAEKNHRFDWDRKTSGESVKTVFSVREYVTTVLYSVFVAPLNKTVFQALSFYLQHTAEMMPCIPAAVAHG